MDNISGNPNWFQEVAEIEEIIKKEVQIELPSLFIDTKPLESFIEDIEINYSLYYDKELGDSLLYLKQALNIIKSTQK
jgi:hypothetical protein